jgi:hypothetical protein
VHEKWPFRTSRVVSFDDVAGRALHLISDLTPTGFEIVPRRHTLRADISQVNQCSHCEVGKLDLREALELGALIAMTEPRTRGRRATARWLLRWLEENTAATIDDAVMVAGLLAALGGQRHNTALAALHATL